MLICGDYASSDALESLLHFLPSFLAMHCYQTTHELSFLVPLLLHDVFAWKFLLGDVFYSLIFISFLFVNTSKRSCSIGFH